ncbi:MAG TPA: hypothetical protein DCS07_04030 [Bdellovibrionales bacterium]|nr:MAG: hypothetical protein A2Z97_11835 [Bdellovibrionales bacterium GWB1_52_6]OFZ05349.1 MAG: hypothetical protein A2X97_16520 [Bdellovibrionales bacterium GWA1_52_35]OFZ43315.1 MAG: hypothetical protein A2070_02800 [Bdellovibrionales bacterium GWC1_52_8]HAR41786.1 hypothetical protein [Bdellovibrionales bacterium]HCM39009.1 hypothetical protein [Bdellovibrionales bacterium]
MSIWNKGLGTGLLLALALGTAGCNQQVQDALQREGMELQQNTQRQEDLLAPLVGHYRGMLRQPDGSADKPVALVLVPTTIIVQNPGRNDITQYPSLGGTLNVIVPPLREGEADDWITIASYDMASLDGFRSRLTLTGNIQSASIGFIKVHFDGVVHPDYSITARISTSLKGEVGTLELTKIADTL